MGGAADDTIQAGLDDLARELGDDEDWADVAGGPTRADVRRRDRRVGWWIPTNGEPVRIADMSDVHLDCVLRYLDRTGNEKSSKRLEVATEIDRRRIAAGKAAAGDIASIDRERANVVITKLGYSPLSMVGTAARKVLLKEFEAARRDERRRLEDGSTSPLVRDLQETLRRLPEVIHTLIPKVTLAEAKAVVDNVRATVEHHNDDNGSGGR